MSTSAAKLARKIRQKWHSSRRMGGTTNIHPRENAMSTVWRFLLKFASIIVCPLHCFDRVIFKGHLAMAAPSELERFVDWVLKVRRCHFINDIAKQWSARLVVHAQAFARKAGRTYLHRTGLCRQERSAAQ